MKQLLTKQGRIVVVQAPPPLVEPGTVTVRVHHSCISPGTELAGLRATATPLWKRALDQPQAVKQVLKSAAAEGFAKTVTRVTGDLALGHPIGYSAAGTVIEVGQGVDDLHPGDRVACAGAQHAHHAQIIRVPRNLAVPTPDTLGFAPASTVTLGAIALQGVRRAAPTLGESFVVIGLGAIGQLTAQCLKANGCRVIATDPDTHRVDLAKQMGLDAALPPDDRNTEAQIARLTQGIGADGVIITAASPSHDIVSTAFRMCRRKGRVVLVGDVGLHLNRQDIYEKELDFFVSTSYGPGRYDPNYEDKGLDYPVGYIRWTENRNMVQYLEMLVQGRINVEPLIAATYPIDEANQAYHALQNVAPGTHRPLMTLIEYSQDSLHQPATTTIITDPIAKPTGADRLRIAVVGPGAFARSVHLPNLKSLAKQYHIHAIVSRTGHNAAAIAKQYNARYATTAYQDVLDDPDIDAVLITTRHDEHARMTLRALQARKHAITEKPLALNETELAAIESFYQSHPTNGTHHPPVLMTGFNRRFSPAAQRLHAWLQPRTGPVILNYRMNAGHLPADHWAKGSEGGGRNIGEACHIYDLLTFLTGAGHRSITAQTAKPKTGYDSPDDNFVATITFDDGSLATLTYTALGSTDYPKEQLDAYCDGKTYHLDDYKNLTAYGSNAPALTARHADKGHTQELRRFARAVQEGGPWPIPLWQQLQATRISFAVQEQIKPR